MQNCAEPLRENGMTVNAMVKQRLRYTALDFDSFSSGVNALYGKDCTLQHSNNMIIKWK